MTNTPVPTPQTADDGDRDLFVVLDTLLENRWLIATITACFLVAGVAYALLAKPVFEASIMVQVEDSPDTSAAKSLLGDISSLFDVKSSAAAETQIVASRLVVSRTVDALKLYIDAQPKRFPVIGSFISRHYDGLSQPRIAGIGGFAWGRESIAVSQFDVPRKYEQDRFKLTVLDANRYSLSGSDLDQDFIGQIGRKEVITTPRGPIVLHVNSIDANAGAVFVLVRNSRERTIDDIQDRLDVQEKVKQSDVVVATIQDTDPLWVSSTMNEIGHQYIRQNIERKSAEAAQSLDFLTGQLPALKQQLADSEARLTKFRNERGTVDLTEEAKVALAQSSDAKTRLLELEQKRAELLTHYTATHPSVIAINREIAALDGYASSTEQEMRQLPDLQQDFVRLMLDVKVNTDLYTALLNNVQQLQLVQAGKVGNVRLVDVAAIPELPVKPKKPLVVIASLLFGLLVGCGTAIARSMLFHGITDHNEIERRLGLSVYATLPYSEHQNDPGDGKKMQRRGKATLLSVDFPGEPAVECVRSLRTAVQFAMLEAKNNIVLIAGPTPGVGKTFISTNLAAVIASGGKRVLLIDGDIRRGRVHDYFGVVRAGGLTDLIAGQAGLEDVVHRNVVDGLDFITTGTIPKNPAELLLKRRLSTVLDDLSRQYDIVIMDTAPILAAPEAGILGGFAGITFVVARAGLTRLGEIAESTKRFSQNGVKVSGVIFNGVNPRLGQYGYKYGGYRYVAYQYGTAAEE
ncbi:polysaccharide biosynthesis tyrosine autokinase [Paraburkholderia sp. EG287B]|uniref:polysaccharide biosynthesis tyrosine autokinase n=1 Tax=Paraburkholderia sp. EG287B TaxID=3237010 RepID=UPI0034D2E13A